MRVLVGCEHSGVVREAFRLRGHEAFSCDLLPAEDGSPYHLQGDLRDELAGEWDLLIAHPDCTYLCSSGQHWNKRRPGREEKSLEAVAFVREILRAPIERIALENPIGILSSRVRRPNQIIQPYQFGHDASKATCLWLKGLPTLRPTRSVAPRIVSGRKRWANQTDSGQNRETPSPDRWKTRARTYDGIAAAMAEQWGRESAWSLEPTLEQALTEVRS